MKITEIQSLISLLEDPDQEIFDQVKEKIVSGGEQMIPFLEDQWTEGSYGQEFCDRIEGVIQEIHLANVHKGLEDWLLSDDKELLDGAILVARMQYPGMDELQVRNFISKLRQEIWLELNENLTAFEKIKVVNHFLFEVHGFKGNKMDYHSVDNSMINKVIESKTGNPLLISLLYIVICQSLDIPVSGINLPNHFVVAYKDKDSVLSLIAPKGDDGILFYINPFGQGAILHQTEIENFLSHLDLATDKRYITPCSNQDMIKRMLNNLLVSYEKSKAIAKVDEVKRLLSLLEPVVTG